MTDIICSSPRFQQPRGWRWHVFTTPNGRKMRFGTVAPDNRTPDAVVVCFPGLSEYAEKYFEIAHDLLDRNLAFWVLDWHGQGLSGRAFQNSQKRHSSGFDDDIQDAHFFLNEYVTHAAIRSDMGRIPIILLAHSMGGNLGLRYLAQYPDSFACAAFSAPMTGIAAVKFLPLSLSVAIAWCLNRLAGDRYVAGGGDWSPEERTNPVKNVFSHDPGRAAIHNEWCLKNAALQVGNVTYGWVYQALRSCLMLRRDVTRNGIHIPCLLALAGDEKLVDNNATRILAANMPHARILDIPGSFHEIMMERDDIRDRFLSAFDDLLHDSKIRGMLKPF